MISFEDKKSGVSFRKSFRFLKEEKKELSFIWMRSGLLFVPVFFLAVGLVFWNERFGFFSDELVILIGAVTLLLLFLFSFLSEQVSFLLHFIKTRHKEIDLSKILEPEKK